MGRRKRVKNIEGSLPKNYDFKTRGSGAKPVPAAPNGNVGSEGNQNRPDVEFIDRVPSDGDGPIPPKQFGWQNPVSKIVLPEPPIVQTGTVPGDASKHDPNFAHRVKK